MRSECWLRSFLGSMLFIFCLRSMIFWAVVSRQQNIYILGRIAPNIRQVSQCTCPCYMFLFFIYFYIGQSLLCCAYKRKTTAYINIKFNKNHTYVWKPDTVHCLLKFGTTVLLISVWLCVAGRLRTHFLTWLDYAMINTQTWLRDVTFFLQLYCYLSIFLKELRYTYYAYSALICLRYLKKYVL